MDNYLMHLEGKLITEQCFVADLEEDETITCMTFVNGTLAVGTSKNKVLFYDLKEDTT